MVQEPERTGLYWHGAAGRIDEHDLRTISAGMLQLAEQGPDETFAAAQFVMPARQPRILYSGTGRVVPVPARTVSQAFASVADADPNRVAVASQVSSITYGQLKQRAAVVQQSLLSAGVRTGDRILVHVSRGPDLIAAMLALWGLGTCYVPVDMTNPAARIAEMARQITPAALLSTANQPPDLGLPLVSPRRPARCPAQPQFLAESANSARQPAYVLFTSGSTGQPKAVEIGHGAMNNHPAMMTDLGMRKDDRM